MHKISVIVVLTHLGTSSAIHFDLCHWWTTTCSKVCCFNTPLFITTFCECLYVYVYIMCRIHWSFKTDSNKKPYARTSSRSFAYSLACSLSQMIWVWRCRQVLRKDNTSYVPLCVFVSCRKLNENNEGKHLIVQSMTLHVRSCASLHTFFSLFCLELFFAIFTQFPWINWIIQN